MMVLSVALCWFLMACIVFSTSRRVSLMAFFDGLHHFLARFAGTGFLCFSEGQPFYVLVFDETLILWMCIIYYLCFRYFTATIFWSFLATFFICLTLPLPLCIVENAFLYLLASFLITTLFSRFSICLVPSRRWLMVALYCWF